MIGAKYYKLYNQLLTDATTYDDIVTGVVHHAANIIPQLAMALGAVLEKGCYKIAAVEGPQFNQPPLMRLAVNDVHRGLYGLEASYICSSKNLEGLPYLTPDATNALTASLEDSLEGPGQVLNLMFFCEGFLKANVLLVCSPRNPLSQDQLDELHFVRNSIEALLYKLHSKQENNLTSYLNTASETMVKSSHLQVTDIRNAMTRLLNLAMELSGEADYGSSQIFLDNHWNYTHAIGHDISILSTIHLPEQFFLNRLADWKECKEVSPNIYIIPNIISKEATPGYTKDKELFDRITEASQPITETIQLHIHFDGVIKGIISLDIKEGNKGTFTQKTIRVLKRVEFLGQILLTYDALHTKNRSFEDLTNLITKLIDPEAGLQSDFLQDYLRLMVDSIYEADYASAYIRDPEGIHFLATIGHNLQALKDIRLQPNHFVSVEAIHDNQIPFPDRDGHGRPVSATLFSDLISYAENMMPEEILAKYLKASSPIKDAIISQAKLSEDSYMYISCDIKQGSSLSFSQDSMHLFSILNNLGFSFISNQYYMNEFRALNKELEDRIAERTKELEESNRKLHYIAIRDSMTGLLNHKTIIGTLDKLVNDGTQVSIFLFDIDYFKKVNDTYGHQIGDEVLMSISHLLNSNKGLPTGRYGGEEFLLIMPNYNHEQALEHCRNLTESIRDGNFIEGWPITVSGGLVTRRDGNASELIQVADTLLYEAKNNGRDQIKDGYK